MKCFDIVSLLEPPQTGKEQEKREKLRAGKKSNHISKMVISYLQKIVLVNFSIIYSRCYL